MIKLVKFPVWVESGLCGALSLLRASLISGQGLREGAFAVGDDGIDLHQRAQRQAATARVVRVRQIAREEFAIDGVDRLQIRHLSGRWSL